MLEKLRPIFEIRLHIPQHPDIGPATAFHEACEVLWQEERHCVVIDPHATLRQDRALVRRAACVNRHGAALIPSEDERLTAFWIVMWLFEFDGFCRAFPNGPTRSLLAGF